MPSRRLLTLSAAVVAAVLVPATAHAESTFVIRGAGFGHGVGMSQYGAMGFASQGSSYRQILAHYYTGTAIGSAPADKVVRVLLRSTPSQLGFTGATKAGGRRLRPGSTYYARNAGGGRVDILTSSKRRLKRVSAPLRVTGSSRQPIKLFGPAMNGRSDGTYRGSFEFLPNSSGGLDAVNHVGLDDYVQGVVPVESPASWPIEALKAQAVAARTYAITTSRSGHFDHYPDTRSQVYGGVAVEVASTNEATQATRGEIVTHNGAPAITYFFSTSGGKTENVENTSLGTEPKPWLKAVDDPFDDVSPRHRWKPVRMSLSAARRKLGSSLVKGSFKGIEVTRRGVSPRIVTAEVIGSRGRVQTDGATLRRKLGLYDSWAYFTTITTDTEEVPEEDPADAPAPQAAADGGAAAPGSGRVGYSRPTPARRLVTGQVTPAKRGSIVQVWTRTASGKWRRVSRAYTDPRGNYSVPVDAAGEYRVRFGGANGPTVRVR